MIRILRDKILNHLVRELPFLSFPEAFGARQADITTKGVDWVPLIVVGNKSDLRSEQRQVHTDEARKLAEEFKCPFTEASAQLNENVSKAFDLMIGEVEKSHNPSDPTGGSKCALM